MNGTIQARGVIGSAALVLGVLVVLAVALLVAAAGDAEAKKKKKKKKGPSYNVVQCPTQASGVSCEGTAANDYLIGGPKDRPSGAYDSISGLEGNDVYNGGNGSDLLIDSSTTSSDAYIFPSTEFSERGVTASIDDEGGAGDIVDLSSYSREDFVESRYGDDDLILEGSGNRDIYIFEFFGSGEIEYFLFRGGWVTGDELASGW